MIFQKQNKVMRLISISLRVARRRGPLSARSLRACWGAAATGPATRVLYRRIPHLLYLFFIAACLLGCNREEVKTENIIRPVKTMLINTPESTTMRIFPGTTLASNEVELSFQIPGQIIKFPVLEGDRVTQGAVIAELDTVIYREKINETSANLYRDKKNFARASELLPGGYLSVSDYDRVKAAYLVSQANYNTALNDLKNAQLIVPFTGVIAKKYVKNYQYIIKRQPVVLLQDKDNIDIEINVPESIITNFKRHQVDKEKMFASFDSIPDKTFRIKLKEYSSQADPQTQTFRIIFTMKRPSNFNILPGMSVSIHAPLGNTDAETTYLIPSSSVFMDKSHQPSVWLIDQKTMQVKKVKVKIANLSSNQIRVLSGLNPNDLIVISGANFLQEGQTVSILK